MGVTRSGCLLRTRFNLRKQGLKLFVNVLKAKQRLHAPVKIFLAHEARSFSKGNVPCTESEAGEVLLVPLMCAGPTP